MQNVTSEIFETCVASFVNGQQNTRKREMSKYISVFECAEGMTYLFFLTAAIWTILFVAYRKCEMQLRDNTMRNEDYATFSLYPR